jgi:TIR domain
MAEIFISYARRNDAKAQELAQSLAKHGYSIFYDHDLNGGDP